MMQPTNAARSKTESGFFAKFSGILTFSETGAIRQPARCSIHHAGPDRSRMSWGIANGFCKPNAPRPICLCRCCVIAGEGAGFLELKEAMALVDSPTHCQLFVLGPKTSEASVL
jgi:hypothetical protein